MRVPGRGPDWRGRDDRTTSRRWPVLKGASADMPGAARWTAAQHHKDRCGFFLPWATIPLLIVIARESAVAAALHRGTSLARYLNQELSPSTYHLLCRWYLDPPALGWFLFILHICWYVSLGRVYTYCTLARLFCPLIIQRLSSPQSLSPPRSLLPAQTSSTPRLSN